MAPGILGDTTDREYTGRLQRFIRFAEREIKQVLDSLAIRPGDRVLDVGCGAGMTTTWLAERAGPAGLAAGFDLSGPHCKIAHDVAPHAKIVQADLQRAPFRSAAFDLVWTLNTVNHLVPVEDGLAALSVLLRPGGLLVAVQSHFLPEMLFAWDASLERAVTDACHQYYRDKYHLQVDQTNATRRLIGAMLDSGLQVVRASTVVIERQQPLTDADRDYFLNGVFRGYWGPKLQPYLTSADWDRVRALCDPESPDYCLARSDFHHVQTLTVVRASKP